MDVFDGDNIRLVCMNLLDALEWNALYQTEPIQRRVEDYTDRKWLEEMPARLIPCSRPLFPSLHLSPTPLKH